MNRRARRYDRDLTRRTLLLTPLLLRAAGRKLSVAIAMARGWRGVSTPWSNDPNLKAPVLEKFAEDAFVFPRAYAASPAPAAAARAISTGKYPHAGSDGTSLAAALGYKTVQRDASGKFPPAPFFFTTPLDPRFPQHADDGSEIELRKNVPPDA